MSYWPSNLLIVFALVLIGYRVVLNVEVTPGVFRILMVTLAYHHWQAHSHLSDGLNPQNDRIRLGVAIGWTLLAGVFLWLS